MSIINPVTAHIAVLKNRADKALRAAQPLLTSAPDNRVSSDSDHPDPTADIVLHPRRVAVASAYDAAVRLVAALKVLEAAEDTLDRLEAANDAWHGRS